MYRSSPHSRRLPLFRRLWKPAAIVSAGGTILVLRFGEILEHGHEFLALVFLIIIAGSIHLLDICIFKSCMPCRDDMKPGDDKGANQ